MHVLCLSHLAICGVKLDTLPLLVVFGQDQTEPDRGPLEEDSSFSFFPFLRYFRGSRAMTIGKLNSTILFVPNSSTAAVCWQVFCYMRSCTSSQHRAWYLAGLPILLSPSKGQSWIQYQGQMVSCPAFAPLSPLTQLFVFLFLDLRLCCPPMTSYFRSLRQLFASESFTFLHTACLCLMSSCACLLYDLCSGTRSSPGGPCPGREGIAGRFT